MSKVFEGNYTKPLPVGTKVKLIADDSKYGYGVDAEYVGQTFEIVHAEKTIDTQTHQINLKAPLPYEQTNWWVFDYQIEVLDYEETEEEA